MAWHETATRWGATSAGILAIGALVAAVARRFREWWLMPWWARTFLAPVKELSTEVGVLSQTIAELQRGLATANGVPLRVALDEHLADATRRLSDIDVAIHETNRRLDECMLSSRPRTNGGN